MIWLLDQVRREKISERMKYLQDLVPGCNKITGKAGMLDEIINYVQSLQRQVEVIIHSLTLFLSQVNFNLHNVYNLISILFITSSSLQYLKQFLSMKLAAVNPRLDFDIDDLFAKEVISRFLDL